MKVGKLSMGITSILHLEQYVHTDMISIVMDCHEQTMNDDNTTLYVFVSYNRLKCVHVLTGQLVLQDNTVYAQLHFLTCVFIPCEYIPLGPDEWSVVSSASLLFALSLCAAKSDF